MSDVGPQTVHQARLFKVVKHLEEFDLAKVISLGTSRVSASNYLINWQAQGLVEQHRSDGRRRLYRAVDRPQRQAEPSETSPSQEGNMWRAMRLLGKFSAKDVAMHSNAGGIEVTYALATKYCRQLHVAGLLRLYARKPAGTRGNFYQLQNDVGPLPPVMKRVRLLFDPNSETFFQSNSGVEQ